MPKRACALLWQRQQCTDSRSAGFFEPQLYANWTTLGRNIVPNIAQPHFTEATKKRLSNTSTGLSSSNYITSADNGIYCYCHYMLLLQRILI